MAVIFPQYPTPGQVYLPPGSSIGYTWTGTFWDKGVVAFTPTGSLEIIVSYVDGDVVSGEVASASLARTALTASYLIGATPSASWASSSLSASYVQTAQTASFVDAARTASYVVNAITASYIQTAQTASFIAANNISGKVSTAGTADTASFVNTSLTASYIDLARSASYVSSSATVITENLRVFGTASIKYLNTEFESSSVIFSSGSSKFGDEFVDVHQFTGSVGVTGSLQVNTSNVILTNQTSSMSVATASYIATAQTASRVTGSNVVGIVAQAYTASIAASRKPTGIVWNAFLTSPAGFGGAVLGNAVFDNNDNGIRLTVASAGQTGNILWNLTGSNAFDFTQDFRGTFSVYYGATAGGFTSGDGFFFNFGGSRTTSQTFAPADNSLSARVETYQASSGSYIYINGTEVAYNKTFTMGVASISSAWNTWIVEVRTVPLLGKRFATLYWGSSLWPQVTVDVTSWTPGGKTFVVGAWTGGAVAAQWCKSAVLEYI